MRGILSRVLLISVFCTVGCVDHDFDLGNLNTEISIGDGQELDLPMGYFEERTLNQIIGLNESNHLYIGERGNYYFMFEEMDGKIGIGFPQKTVIPAIRSTFPIEMESITEGYTGPIPAGEMEGTTSMQTDLEITGKFASYLKAIDRIIFEPDSGKETTSMELLLHLNSLSEVNSGATFTVTVTAPEGMELYDGETGTGKSKMARTLKFEEGDTVAMTEIRYRDINLTPDMYTLDTLGNFHMKTPFRFDVEYSLASKYGEVTLASLPTLSVNAAPKYYGADIELSPNAFEREEAEVDTGSVKGNYEVTINNMDLNPLVYLRVGNTFPVGAKARITFSSEDGEVSIDDIAIEEALWEDGKMTYRGDDDILLARKDTDEGKEFYECDLTSLFEGEIPDLLNIGLDVQTLDGKYTVYLADYFTLDYAYHIEIPMKFGSEFSLTFSTIASGFKSSIDDLRKFTARDASLYIDMYNSMPLDADLPNDGIVLLDKDGDEIDPTLAHVNILSGEMAGSADGTETHSLIKAQLYLKDGKFSNISSLDRIMLKFDARSVGDDMELNRNQKLYGEITLHVEDGVQIKL